MFLMQMAWRNLWRYPKRTLLTAFALMMTTLALVFLLSFQIGVYETMKQQTLKLLDGYAQFQNPAFLDTPSIRNRFELTAALEQDLTTLKKQYPAFIWGYRGQSFGLFSYEQQNVAGMLLGVQPEKEPLLSTLPSRVVKGRYLQPQDTHQVVIGTTLAERLGISLGGELQLIAQDAQGSVAADLLTVVGLLDSGMDELNRQLVVMPFEYFQTLFAMPGQAHQIVMEMDTLAQIEALAPKLDTIAKNNDLVLRDWKSLEPGLYHGIQLDFFSGLIWYIAILVIVVLILLNTLLMSILEREREFGLMLSLGLSHRQLNGLIQLEIQLTLMLGILLGIAIGAALAYYYSIEGITLPGTDALFSQFGLTSTLYPTLSAFALWFAPLFLWAGSVLMGLYIMFKLYRLTPISGRQVGGG